MPNDDTSLLEVYVQPGESHLVAEPAVLRTVLGSCVGIAWFIPRLGLGALCHPMLPSCPVDMRTHIRPAAGRRYVDYAIHEMASSLDALGVRRNEVQVKLFGGADVLPAITDPRRPTVGHMNSEVAARVLREEGFRVSASSLGGSCGLNLRFDTTSGEVLVRRLPAHNASRRTGELPQ
jgi:chemotaxis protein CheD